MSNAGKLESLVQLLQAGFLCQCSFYDLGDNKDSLKIHDSDCIGPAKAMELLQQEEQSK